MVFVRTPPGRDLNDIAQVIKSHQGRNIRKNCSLIALGGGILQDITAFVSMVMFRGIEWLFVPTTLLAQADSCIGSKVSINFEMYKNLPGGFYPPCHVLIDPGFLETLPAGEIKSGIGEILHYYLIADSPLTGELMDHYEEHLQAPRKLGKFIQESLGIKKKRSKLMNWIKGPVISSIMDTPSGMPSKPCRTTPSIMGRRLPWGWIWPTSSP